MMMSMVLVVTFGNSINSSNGWLGSMAAAMGWFLKGEMSCCRLAIMMLRMMMMPMSRALTRETMVFNRCGIDLRYLDWMMSTKIEYGAASTERVRSTRSVFDPHDVDGNGDGNGSLR